jgi:hypothetical protein
MGVRPSGMKLLPTVVFALSTAATLLPRIAES